MDDEKIVKLYWDRNEQAITETSEKYGHYCTKIAYNILSSNEDAQECVAIQAIFFKTGCSDLCNQVEILCLHRTDEGRNAGTVNDYFFFLDGLCDIVSDKENVEEAFSHKELAEAISQFLNELSQEKRYMFIRRYWYTDSVKNIAEKCGRSENSVSVELNRTRKKLCDYLKERGFDL